MTKAAVYEQLEKLGIDYKKIDHDPAATMADCVVIGEKLGAPMCKNLFLCNRQETEFFLLLISSDKPFVTKDVSKTLGKARLSFGKEPQLYDFLRCHGGGISPMGLLFDKEHNVNLVIDEDVLKTAAFSVHPCDNTASIALHTQDFLKVFLKATGHNPNIIHID